MDVGSAVLEMLIEYKSLFEGPMLATFLVLTKESHPNLNAQGDTHAVTPGVAAYGGFLK